MLQRTAVSGWPLLTIAARKGCAAPRMTPAVAGVIAIPTSLVMVNIAVADFVGSLLLVAVICTNRSDGQIDWSCVDTGGGDGADGGIAASDGVDAPGDGGVRCAGDCGGESLRVA